MLNAKQPSASRLEVGQIIPLAMERFYQQWIAEREADLPSIGELLESLRYLNKLCTP
jgi:hypothetical protein